MNGISIRVYASNSDFAQNKPIITRTIASNEALSFPYDSVIRGLKALFGLDCVIDFCVL